MLTSKKKKNKESYLKIKDLPVPSSQTLFLIHTHTFLDLLPHFGEAYSITAFWEKATWEVSFLTPWIFKNTFIPFLHLNDSLLAYKIQDWNDLSFGISEVLFHCHLTLHVATEKPDNILIPNPLCVSWFLSLEAFRILFFNLSIQKFHSDKLLFGSFFLHYFDLTLVSPLFLFCFVCLFPSSFIEI